MKRAYNRKLGLEVSVKGTTAIPYVQLANKKLYTLTTAVTSGATTDSVGAVAGDLAVTTNATGRGGMFFSDGTNWVAIGDGGAGFTQGLAVADPGAMTATNPTAPTAYTAHAAGAVPVTSDAATDLDTTAAALATLRTEVAGYETTISALVVDVAVVRTALIALITSLENGEIIA